MKPRRPLSFLPAAVIFALMGAFFWAIRGTGGFGGAQGGILAGLGWAMLWLGFSRWFGQDRRRPYGHGHLVPAILLGIACGGLTGYGVYIGWIQGHFYLDYPEGVREIAPWTGYTMLFFCGLHWGGLTGVFMAWAAPRRPLGKAVWAIRLLFGVAGAFAAYGTVVANPGWFLPFYDEGLYSDPNNKTCLRAEGSIRNIAPHLGACFGFLMFEMIRRDSRAIAVILIMGLGFALSFSIGGIWQTGNGSELALDWWKFWELSIGLGGGLTLAIVFHQFNRPDPSSPPRSMTRCEKIGSLGVLAWFGAATVLANGIEGWSRRHEVRITPFVLPIFGLIVFGLLGFLHVRSLRRAKENGIGEASRLMPLWLIPMVLIAIAVAGFVASIPPELRLADTVLLSIYLLCVAGSLGCYGKLRTQSSLPTRSREL